MNKKITATFIALVMAISFNATAQNVYDVITLKNGQGVIKGFINEQILGKSVNIIPNEATIQIRYSDIAILPTKKYIKKVQD